MLRASDAEDIDADAARIAEMRKRMEGMFSGAEAPAAPAVKDASALVPLVLAVDPQVIAAFGRDAGRQVDVVGDEQCSTTLKFDDEALVARALFVVGKKFQEFALDRDHEAGLLFAYGGFNLLIGVGAVAARWG